MVRRRSSYFWLISWQSLQRIRWWWRVDFSDIPLQKGFLYLAAVVDLCSTNVLNWTLTSSLDQSSSIRIRVVSSHQESKICRPDGKFCGASILVERLCAA